MIRKLERVGLKFGLEEQTNIKLKAWKKNYSKRLSWNFDDSKIVFNCIIHQFHKNYIVVHYGELIKTSVLLIRQLFSFGIYAESEGAQDSKES